MSISSSLEDIRSFDFGFVAAAFLAICAGKIFYTLHLGSWDVLSDASFGITAGTPQWIAYQNRIMGPYAVLMIAELGISYTESLIAFSVFILTVQSVLFYWMCKRVTNSESISLGFLLFSLFMFLFAQHYWFFVWDSIDFLIFTIFAFGMFFGFSTSAYVALFCVALLNRETALFVALYIFIDGFSLQKGRLIFLKATDVRKIILGISLLIIGIVYTKLIRDFLMVEAIYSGAPGEQYIGNHIYLYLNIRDLLWDNFFGVTIFETVLMYIAGLFLLYKLPKLTESGLKGAFIIVAFFINIMVFGEINESRMLIPLIPMYGFFLLSVFVQRDESDKIQRTRETARSA